MPTDRKLKEVDELRKLLESATAIVTTDHSEVKVSDMTELRRALREQDVTFRVVKNRLTERAAKAAGVPNIMEIVQGPTAIAFGFEEPVVPAKALTEFISKSRITLKIRGGLLEVGRSREMKWVIWRLCRLRRNLWRSSSARCRGPSQILH